MCTGRPQIFCMCNQQHSKKTKMSVQFQKFDLTESAPAPAAHPPAPAQPNPLPDGANNVCILNFTEANFTCNTNNTGYDSQSGLWQQSFPTMVAPTDFAMQDRWLASSRFTWSGIAVMRSGISNGSVSTIHNQYYKTIPGGPSGIDIPQYSVGPVFNPYNNTTRAMDQGDTDKNYGMSEVCPWVDSPPKNLTSDPNLAACQQSCCPGAFMGQCNFSGGCSCSSLHACLNYENVTFNGLPSCPTSVYADDGSIVPGALICDGDETGTGSLLPVYFFNNSFEFGGSWDDSGNLTNQPITADSNGMDQYMKAMLRGVVISAVYLPDPAQPGGTQINTAVYLFTRPNAVLLQNLTDMDLVVTGTYMDDIPDINCFSSLWSNTPGSTNYVYYNTRSEVISTNGRVYILNSGRFNPSTGDRIPGFECSAPSKTAIADDFTCPSNQPGALGNAYQRRFTMQAPENSSLTYGAGTFEFTPDGKSTTTVNLSNPDSPFSWPIYQNIVVTSTQQFLNVMIYIPVEITNNTPLYMSIFYTSSYKDIPFDRTETVAPGNSVTLPFGYLNVMAVSFNNEDNTLSMSNLVFPSTNNIGTVTTMDAPLLCVPPPVASCPSSAGCACTGIAPVDSSNNKLTSGQDALMYGTNRFYAYGDVSSGFNKAISVTMPTVAIVNSTATQTLTLWNVYPNVHSPVDIEPGNYASVSVADLGNLQMYYTNI